MSPFLNFDDHHLRCWLPIVGRVRHITTHVTEPARGVAVECLCGRDFIAGTVKAVPAVYDCTFCFQVWTEQSEPLVVPRQLSPQLPTAPHRGGQAFSPLAAGVPDPAASGPPLEVTSCP